MATIKQIINIGNQSNDGTGDSIRDAFKKTNENFDLIFNTAGLGDGLSFTGFRDGPTALNTSSVLVTDSIGLTVTQAQLVEGTGIQINYDYNLGIITFSNTRSALNTDTNPYLSADLSGSFSYRAKNFSDPKADQDLATRRWIHDNFVNRDATYQYETGIPPSTSTVVNGSTMRQPAQIVPSTTASWLVGKSISVYNANGTATNISIETASTSSAAVTRKDYVDTKISLQGTETRDPATGEVNPGFGQMTGPLVLFRNPIESDDDYTAATKRYVDNNTYWSENNIFVNSKGLDFQPATFPERKGRSPQNAFATINRAAQYAEALIATSQIEVGDYARLITYDGGLAATVTSNTNNYAGSKLSRVVINCGTGGSDQFGNVEPGKYTIFPGQYVQGVESGAIGLIESIASGGAGQEIYTLQYVDYADDFDTDITTSIPDITNSNIVRFTFVDTEYVPIPAFWVGYKFYTDTGTPNGTILSYGGTVDFQGWYHLYFDVEFTTGAPSAGQTISGPDWHVYSGDLQAGETVVYNTNVSNYQITIVVESNEYYEQYPIKLPANTSIRGDEFRRVIIRPASGVSGSKWATTYFKRDTQIDGMQVVAVNTITNYGNTGTLFGSVATPSGSSGDITVTLDTGWIPSEYKGWLFTGNGGQGVITSCNSTTFTVNVGTTLLDSGYIPSGNWTIRKPYNFGYHYLRDPSKPLNVLNNLENRGSYYNAYKQLVANREFIQDEVIKFIDNSYAPGFVYDKTICRRDIGLVVDCLSDDLLYGGWTRSVNAGDSYLSVAVVKAGQLIQTTSAINYVGTIADRIIRNLTVTPLQNVSTQTFVGVSVETGGQAVLADLVQIITRILNDDPAYNPPKKNNEMDVFLCNDANVIRYVSCQNHGGFMMVLDPEGQIRNKSPYTQTASSFSQSLAKQRFAGGMFIDAFTGNALAYPTVSSFSNPTSVTVSGLLRRPQVPTFFTTNGVRYEVDFISSFQEDGSNPGTYTATLNLNPLNPGGITDDVTVSDPVGGFKINQTNIPITFDAPTGTGGLKARGYATSNVAGQINSIHVTFPGSGYIATPGIVVGGAIINNLVINTTGHITNFNIASGGSGFTTLTQFKINPVGAFSVTTATGQVTAVDATGAITSATIVSGSSGTNWSSSINYKVTFGTPVITVQTPVAGYIDTVPESFELQTAGNRSMLANDFTQVNDLGYGIFCTNGGFAENVSMFTYYNHVSYYSLNGSQIRSTTGSSCYGDYGLVAEGSDPNEVPTAATLAYGLTQVGTAYVSTPLYTALTDATSMYVLIDYANGGYPPYSSGQLEINHSGIIQNYTISASSLVLDTNNGNIPLTVGGKYVYLLTFGPQGLIADVSNSTPVAIRAEAVFKLNGFDPTSFSRPSTALTFADDPNQVYHVTSYSAVQTDNAVFTYTLEDYNYITFQTQEQGVTYPKITNSGTSYTTATVTISTATLSANFTRTVFGNQGSASVGVQAITLATGASTPIVGQYVNGNTITTGTIVTYINSNVIGISIPTNGQISSATVLTFSSPRPTANVTLSGGNLTSVTVTGGAGWTNTTTTISITGNGSSAVITSPINLAGTIGSKVIKISNLDATGAGRISAGLAASPQIFYEFAWNGQKFKILAYRSTTVTGQSWAEIDVDQALTSAVKQGATLQAGLPTGSSAAITTRISLCRVTGHDFVDIGTGGYATTRIPNDLYGPPTIPANQAKEVTERGKGRVYYATTDQDGNFRVGSAFRVNQAEGTVTISAPLDLTNLTSLSLKKDLGPAITQFSIDDTMVAEADYNVPTEHAVVNYINRRLGLDRNGNIYAGSPLGPQFLPLNGKLAMAGAIDMGSTNVIKNLASPRQGYGTDATNKNYVDTKISNRGTDSKDVDGTTPAPGFGVMYGSLQLSGDPIVVTTTTAVDAFTGAFNITLSSVQGVTLQHQVNGTNIAPGTYVSALVSGTNIITLNNAITGNVLNGSTLVFDPIVQAATKRYVDKNRQLNQLVDTAISTATDTDLLMFAGAISVNTTTNPPIYNAGRKVVNVTNNTTAPANTVGTSAGGSDISVTRINNTVTFKLVSGPITNYHVNASAGIVQSKLNMSTATTRVNATGIAQVDLGLASFDSSFFTATNGWVSLSLNNNLTTTADLAHDLGASSTRWSNLFVNTATISKDLHVIGDVTVSGGDINANSASLNLANTTATTINFGGSGTAITIGAATGWTTIRNITTVSNTTNASTVTNGALHIVGGVGIEQDAYIGGQLYVGGSPVLTQAGYTPGGVQQLVAGSNIALSPITGTGTVTVSVTGQLGVPTVIGSANQVLVNGVSGSTGTTATFTLSPTLDITVQNLRAVNPTGATVYGTWTLSAGSTFQATYADLAEWYSADADYEPGTVLIFGGSAEVTVTTIYSDSRVAGVVTTDPAYVMNAGLEGTKACIALQGRIPVKVMGYIKKGDLLTTADNSGYATKAINPQVGTIIGKALEDKLTPEKGIIEVAIGRM
jgi:hypothetical protein